MKIYSTEQKIIPISPRWMICLSQWFIMVCLWLYCIRITEMSDTSITVIYHGMSLTVLYQNHRDEWYSTSITVIYHDMSPTVLYQNHWDEWYVYHSDLSWHVSDYCIRIPEMSDISITVIYHSTFLYVSDCTVPVSSCCWSTGSCKCSFHSSDNCLCVIWRKTFRA